MRKRRRNPKKPIKKFLICGFGNVAQRHFRNLKRLLPSCKINVYTSIKGLYRIFDNNLNIKYTDNLMNFYNINNIYYDIEDALDAELHYDGVIICSLPPERIDIARKSANRNHNLFIEKPLSNIIDDKIDILKDKVCQKELICAIGYQMRFHPIIKETKKIIKNKLLGDVYRIEIIHGNSIYNWTKDRDLKDFYALKEENAGGVIFSQIHELDYLYYIFGKYFYSEHAVGVNYLDIKHNTEDNISILGSIPSPYDGRDIPANIHLDFISRIPTRKLIIYGIKKEIEVDIMNGVLFDKFNNEKHFFNIEWNTLFLNEMKAFLQSLNGEWKEPLAKLSDGISSLECAIDIKNLLNG